MKRKIKEIGTQIRLIEENRHLHMYKVPKRSRIRPEPGAILPWLSLHGTSRTGERTDSKPGMSRGLVYTAISL